MYCKKCGVSIPDDSIFCNKCGARQFDEAPVDETPVKEAAAFNNAKRGGAAVEIRPHMPVKKPGKWTLPTIEDDLLIRRSDSSVKVSDEDVESMKANLLYALESFGIKAVISSVAVGPSFTRIELLPAPGEKISDIMKLSADLQVALKAIEIRIEAPVPGRSPLAIELPNKVTETVSLYEVLGSDEFRLVNAPDRLDFALGKGLAGRYIIADISRMPHLLIAGATGSGKSVCINSLIMSILFKYTPDEVKLILIDPKEVELSGYNGIPHLLAPVITDMDLAGAALRWAVGEMNERYEKFANLKVRDIAGYNKKMMHAPMQRIIIVIDELLDLMQSQGKEMEGLISRLAHLARACGIHLVISAQKPDVSVITNTMKTNIPSRIAFSVNTSVDSRAIIDEAGAEKLLGKGDMLFLAQGKMKPERLQGAYVAEDEIMRVVDFWHIQAFKNPPEEMLDLETILEEEEAKALAFEEEDEEDEEEIQAEAARESEAAEEIIAERAALSSQEELPPAYLKKITAFIVRYDNVSIGMLQRNFAVGFNKATAILDELARRGIVSEQEKGGSRQVILTLEEYKEQYEAGD